MTQQETPPVTTTHQAPPAAHIPEPSPDTRLAAPPQQKIPETIPADPETAIKDTSPTAETKPLPDINELLAEKGYIQFTADDAHGANDPIMVNISDYRVAKGDEFEVSVRLQAPALESMTLLMNYDPALLEYLPETARVVGKSFHLGIEFYADQQKGRMVLINSGLPGAKNIYPTGNEVIAVFRMVAKEAGQTQITFPESGVSFTNAVGRETTDYKINGGTITISE
jgi:hypothetical protein